MQQKHTAGESLNKQQLLVTSLPEGPGRQPNTQSLGLASTLCWQHCKCLECALCMSVHKATPIPQHLHNVPDTTSCAAVCLPLTLTGRGGSTSPAALHSLKSTATRAGCTVVDACSLRLLMEALKDTTSSRSTLAVTTWQHNIQDAAG